MYLYKAVTMSAIFIFVLSFSGCVSQQEQGPSSFIVNPPPFEAGLEGVDKRYVKKDVDFSKYKKIMMDEVVFYFDREADYKGIQPSEINTLNESFNKAFIAELAESYPFTDKPGPDVMRVRVAITDIEPSSPVSGTMTTIIPVGLAVSLMKKGVTGEYAGIGSASMEAEFLDSITNERIGAAMDKAPGGKLDVKKLSAAEAAFKFWAKRLKVFMDKVHGN